jgi:hypothetical protein
MRKIAEYLALTGKHEDKSGNAIQLLSVMLLPVARLMLRNGFGAGELVGAAKLASVQAALTEVISPGSKVNVSRLSVATGLTRKEISALLGRTKEAKAFRSRPTLEQRAWRVLHGWHTDPKYREDSGRLAALPFSGKQRTFSSLVRRYGGDVTPLSVLRELERIRVVAKTGSGLLRLHARALRSRSLVTEQIAELARVFKDFAATVTAGEENPQSFFGFKDAMIPSIDQAALFRRTFSERGTILLESFEQWLKSQSRHAGRSASSSKASVRVGVGVYLVQDKSALVLGSRSTKWPIRH